MATAGAGGETTSDWSLLARIAQKDEEALSALYGRYSGLVFSTAKRILHGTGEAEEILQDVFYQIWETAERFDPERGSFSGWLLVAARNRAISKLRGKREWAGELDENGVSLSVEIESRTALQGEYRNRPGRRFWLARVNPALREFSLKTESKTLDRAYSTWNEAVPLRQ